MISEMSDTNIAGPAHGWVLFDSDCSLCRGLVHRSRFSVERAGFRFAPLQSAWVRARLNLPEHVLLAEMRLLTTDGRFFGGADAMVQLARGMRPRHRPWWAWLLLVAANLPFGTPMLRSGYRRVAARRYCRQGGCAIISHSGDREGTR